MGIFMNFERVDGMAMYKNSLLQLKNWKMVTVYGKSEPNEPLPTAVLNCKGLNLMKLSTISVGGITFSIYVYPFCWC